MWYLVGGAATAMFAHFAPLWVTLTVGTAAVVILVTIVLRADSLAEGLRRIHLGKPRSE